jgi:TRAP transporter T-component
VKRRALALGLLLAVAGCPGGPLERPASGTSAEATQAALAEGDAAWPRRADPAGLLAALSAWRRAAAVRPGDPAIELRLARAEGFRALAAALPAEALAAHDASSRAAERALRTASPRFAAAVDQGRPLAEAAALVEPSGAEPLYWLALGRFGVAQGTGPAAVLAVKDQALALMARAADLDERLEAGGPLRALGAWSAMLPAAAGGGVEAARARFERAAQLHPDEPWRRVDEARSLSVLLQDRAGFERLLGEVLAAPDAAERGPEQAVARRRAREWLDKRARLF